MLCCVCDLPVHTHVCTVIEELVFTFHMKSRRLKGDPLYPTSRVYPGLPLRGQAREPSILRFPGQFGFRDMPRNVVREL